MIPWKVIFILKSENSNFFLASTSSNWRASAGILITKIITVDFSGFQSGAWEAQKFYFKNNISKVWIKFERCLKCVPLRKRIFSKLNFCPLQRGYCSLGILPASPNELHGFKLAKIGPRTSMLTAGWVGLSKKGIFWEVRISIKNDCQNTEIKISLLRNQ